MNSEGPPSQPDARLTPIQLAILTTIRRLTQERRGRPPPMRQVAATVSRSLSALYYEYSELEDKGYLRRQPRHPLTVEARLPGEPPFGPEAGDPRPYAKTETVAWVPIAGQIAAGPPILAEPRPSEGYLPLPREVVGRAEGLFILQVSGDSMTGVGINSGDWVVVRQLFQPPRNGDIVAAEIEGVEVEGTVKTYMKDGRDVWLMPQNPAYLPIRGNGAKIQGKVVALLRRVDRKPRRRLPGIPQGRRPALIPEGNPGISTTQRLLAGSVACRTGSDPVKPPMAFLYQLLPSSLAATNVKLWQTHYRSNTPEFYLPVTEVTHEYTAFEAIQMLHARRRSERADPSYVSGQDPIGGVMRKRLCAFTILPALMLGLMTAVCAAPGAASAVTKAHNTQARILASNKACRASKAFAVSAAASAVTRAHNAKARILATNGACGASDPALKPIGFVNFHRVRNAVSMNVHLKGARPHAMYNVFLFENAPRFCHLIDGRLGTVRTNGEGVGNGHFTVMVPANATKFFADPTVKPTPFIFPSNDTTTVTLP